MRHGNREERERDVLASYGLAASIELIHRRKERQERFLQEKTVP